MAENVTVFMLRTDFSACQKSVCGMMFQTAGHVPFFLFLLLSLVKQNACLEKWSITAVRCYRLIALGILFALSSGIYLDFFCPPLPF